ncbi:MAG: peptide deformylase [Candidatus Sericytochromatia bacterium]|nr:peptide deformylase [Candidatus Sericytochromatia bacterium]
MALLEIAKLGNPVLRRMAEPVTPEELASPETQRLIDDMIETMRAAAGIGLAAPQVSVSKQIQIIEMAANPRYPAAPTWPLTVLVNPEITFLTDERIEVWEGCLSVDGLRGKVRRVRRIALRFLDRHGEEQHLELEDFPAVVAQHETDHLVGKVFLDRMEDMSSLAQIAEWERYWLADPALVTE